MRLKGGDDAPPGKGAARRAQRGADLRGVMRVVVENRDASGLSDALESALDATEVGEPANERRGRRAEGESRAEGGERVEYVMTPGDPDRDGA